ncbi:hypothetical protein CC80DRAFT_547291 [Byssothecium circinans]|uniref:Uncharacterized protein n=1 Tax=Byssothecium circinans TaxID=147558 RepID=A0A6A5TXL1_9PLEO|nr:hypothetical protein CC80DRAFT_547291 [Byssothecium circinans]
MASASGSRDPPRQQRSSKDKKAWRKVMEDEETLKELEAESKASVFYDYSAPGTLKACQLARARFEDFVEEKFSVTQESEIWNAETITDRTKQSPSGLARSSKGLFKDRVKASTLWSTKHCLCWWAVRFILKFSHVFHECHASVTAHIHWIAVEHSLTTDFHEKNTLGDAELALMFQEIQEQKYGSFTTSSKIQPFNQTLRCKGVTFVYTASGISARVKFQFYKGHLNLHDEEAMGDESRFFIFLRTLGNQYEFDLALILFGLAYKRGLFKGRTLEKILSGDEKFLPKDPDADEQPVFVAATHSVGINTSKAMRVSALNDKMHQLCLKIGLLRRYTYYTLRREAIIATRQTLGSEAARDLAFHRYVHPHLGRDN